TNSHRLHHVVGYDFPARLLEFPVLRSFCRPFSMAEVPNSAPQ
ncbi:MAG: hypothetical protein ACI93T_002047, partial [Porticoccaceae bacterium]